MCVCVCAFVCVREREKERERETLCVCVCVSARACVCACVGSPSSLLNSTKVGLSGAVTKARGPGSTCSFADRSVTHLSLLSGTPPQKTVDPRDRPCLLELDRYEYALPGS